MNKQDDNSKKLRFFVGGYLIISMIGVSVPILLSLIASLLVSIEKLSPSAIAPSAYAFVFMGVFVSGFLTARKFGKPIFSSLIQSSICFLIFYIGGAIVFGRLFPGDGIWQISLACFSGGILGAIFSTFFVKKKRLKSFKLDK